MVAQPQPDKSHSLVYYLSGVLFVLVLLEKSLSGGDMANPQFANQVAHPRAIESARKTAEDSLDSGKNSWAKGFAGFKNIGRNFGSADEIPVADLPSGKWETNNTSGEGQSRSFPTSESPRLTDEAWEIQAEKEINQWIGEDEIPILESGSPAAGDSHVNVYFIKFFGSDNKAESRLVRVPRIVPTGKDPILFVLQELKKGPRPEEKSKGVLNSLPPQFRYSTQYTLKDGILTLDLGEEFEFGGGPQIIKDRMDQIAHSLVGIAGVRGIQFTIERKKVSQLGGDGIPLPPVLGKRDRKITTL